MPGSSVSPNFSEDKHTSGEEDVTPKASPLVADDENDTTLTMPSTSQGYQADSSPAHARSVPSSQEATSPPAARRVETPLGVVPNQQFYYFTTDMANQAALDIEKEKEKFDSLVSWYKVTREDLPALGTSSVGNSTAPSYVSDKGSTTPMSSQPSSHQSGASGPHSSGLNGFSYSPFALDNPSSHDPLERCSSPVNLDDINPTLEDFMASEPSSSAMSQQMNQMPMYPPMHPMNQQIPPMPQMTQQQSSPSPYTHRPLSNPPSNQGLKRKAPSEDVPVSSPVSSSYNPGSAKQIKLEHYSSPLAAAPRTEDPCPMRKLEMMANAQNFMAGNNINEVVEASKKDEKAAKLEKLDGIEKSVEEEMAQEREAQKLRMAAAAHAQQFPSPGQFPGMPGPGYPGMMPGMPPHPGMPHPGMQMPGGGPPFSAGAAYPPMPGGGAPGQYPPFPMYPGAAPGITPGGYPMSAPGKMQMPFPSPTFHAPSPAAMAAMQQQAAMEQQQRQAAMQQHAAAAAAARGMPPMPHPSMMTPQQQQQFMFMQMQMAAAQKGMSPNMMGHRGSPMPSPFPPGHPAHQNPAAAAAWHHQTMMMRHAQFAQAQAAAAARGEGPGGSGMPQGMPQGMPPFGFPGGPPMPGSMPGMPGMPNGMHGMPGAMPNGMPGSMPGMPGSMQAGMHGGMPGMPGMPPGMQVPMSGTMPKMPSHPGTPNPHQAAQNAASALLVAGNRGSMDTSMGGMGNMWQLTPHYPPPFPHSFPANPTSRPESSTSGSATPRQ